MRKIGLVLALLVSWAVADLPARVDLTTSLISYWKLDETSSTREDIHGGNDLTDNNTVGSSTGKISNGADFIPANSESLSHADNADLSTGDIDFTLCAWVKADDLSTERAVIGKYHETTAAAREYKLSVHPSFGVVWALNNGFADVFHFTGSPGALSTGTWYHICGWNDAANNIIGFSVNAGSAQETSWSGGTQDTTSTFALGGYTAAGVGTPDAQFWDGIIDEVGLWKRVLTSQERTDLYNSGNGFAYPFDGGGAPATAAPALINNPVRCCDRGRR